MLPSELAVPVTTTFCPTERSFIEPSADFIIGVDVAINTTWLLPPAVWTVTL
jgi:hypothetical protein